MKYKKRYNILVVLLLFIIAGSVACYSLLNLDHVESAEDDTVINVIEDEEVKEDSVETTPSKKVQFTQFSTALRYAYNYLNNTQGYKSYIHGFFSLSVANIIDISQDVDVYASVNNRENKYRAVVQTTGTGKIKAEKGFEFVRMGDEISYRKGDKNNSGSFDFTTTDINRKSVNDFVSEWGVEANKVFWGYDYNQASKLNGKLLKSGNEYSLIFTLNDGVVVSQCTKFVKSLFGNSWRAQCINPVFDAVNVKITLDQYGRLKNAKYSVTYHDLDLRDAGIPLSGLKGKVEYTQTFYNLGQNIQVQPI